MITSKTIELMLQDCMTVREDSVLAINTQAASEERYRDKQLIDAVNRQAIAMTLMAQAMLGIQLEGAVVREAMEEAAGKGK